MEPPTTERAGLTPGEAQVKVILNYTVVNLRPVYLRGQRGSKEGHLWQNLTPRWGVCLVTPQPWPHCCTWTCESSQAAAHPGLPSASGGLCAQAIVSRSAGLQGGSRLHSLLYGVFLDPVLNQRALGSQVVMCFLLCRPCVATAVCAGVTRTSLSKSWSGSDMLLRGTLTPGSDPPVDSDTFDLRERSRGRQRMEFLPQHLPPVIPDEGHEM